MQLPCASTGATKSTTRVCSTRPPIRRENWCCRKCHKQSPSISPTWGALSGRQQIAVGLEQSRGPLLFALLQFDFLVIYTINPTTLAKYRQAFSPSRAKDDPTDAE